MSCCKCCRCDCHQVTTVSAVKTYPELRQPAREAVSKLIADAGPNALRIVYDKYGRATCLSEIGDEKLRDFLRDVLRAHKQWHNLAARELSRQLMSTYGTFVCG